MGSTQRKPGAAQRQACAGLTSRHRQGPQPRRWGSQAARPDSLRLARLHPKGLPSLPAASPRHPRKAGLRLNDPLQGVAAAPSTAPKHLEFQAQSKLIFSFIEQRETALLNSFDTLAAALCAAGPGLRPTFELRGGKQGKGAHLVSEASPQNPCACFLLPRPGGADPTACWQSRPAARTPGQPSCAREGSAPRVPAVPRTAARTASRTRDATFVLSVLLWT